MPTANSIQTKASTRRTIAAMRILTSIVLEDFKMRLMINAVPKRSIPAIRKSKADQLKPSTNIFPRKAIAKSNEGMAKITVVFCCFVMIFIYFNLKHFVFQSLFSKKIELYLPNNFSSASKCSVKAILPVCVTL